MTRVMTLDEVGLALGMNRESVRRIEKRALYKLERNGMRKALDMLIVLRNERRYAGPPERSRWPDAGQDHHG